MPGEDLENEFDVILDAGRKRIPIIGRNLTRERLDMEVVFHINRKRIHHRLRFARFSCHSSMGPFFPICATVRATAG
jgi:hypothetical protein